MDKNVTQVNPSHYHEQIFKLLLLEFNYTDSRLEREERGKIEIKRARAQIMFGMIKEEDQEELCLWQMWFSVDLVTL